MSEPVRARGSQPSYMQTPSHTPDKERRCASRHRSRRGRRHVLESVLSSESGL